MDSSYLLQQVLSVSQVTSGDLLIISATAAVESSVQAHLFQGKFVALGQPSAYEDQMSQGPTLH